MIADVPQIATALIVSAVVSIGASIVKQDVQGRLLEDNILVTKELAKEVSNLNTTIAVFQEKYVTKKELEEKIKEAPDGTGNR